MRILTRAIAALLLLVASTSLVATCGQKGPLRLPDETTVAAEPHAPRW